MTIRFASLGSGSKGNGTLLESAGTCVLVDCGFSIRETEKRLARLGCRAEDISAILVTHEHSDHGRGVVPLAKKYSIPVVMTAGTARALNPAGLQEIRLINAQAAFAVGGMTVTPVAVPHDAREPVQFVFTRHQRRVGILTDLGCITPHVLSSYDGCDGLLLEANHDAALLAGGAYPASLKRRVGGDWGHLNNGQAAGLLARIERRRLQVLVMGHISQQNNHVDLVRDAVAPYQDDLQNVHYACQEEGFHWQVVD
ncbi:MAG: beta-lactamase [Gammaproteobacteria bacterium BRH_c0]|nr:MAG: beta-lactamase [Gammaproteobacteria bacterium BRH_c0]